MITAALLLAAACSGPPAIALEGDYARLTAGVEALDDPGRSYTLAQVTGEPRCHEFAPVHGTASLGSTRSGLWLRLRLDLPSGPPDQYRLLIRFGGLAHACAHWPLRDGRVRSDCASPRQATAHAKRTRLGYLFTPPVDLDPGRPIHVYGDSEVWLKLPLELGSADALLQHEHRAQLGWGLYYGVLLATVLMSLVVYLGRSDRAFLYFSLHIASLTAALAIWQGRLSGWDTLAGWSLERLAPPLTAVSLALGARFYQRFLDTDLRVPWADRLLRVCFWLSLILALAVFLDPVHSTPLLGAVALLWIGAVLGAAMVRLRQHFRAAASVLAAVAVLLVALFANALEVVGLKLFDPETALALLYLGVLLAAGFLVFGLAARVRLLAQERDHATGLAQAGQQLVLHRSRFDELSGLPNRAKFSDDVSERLILGALGSKRFALVSIGLDRFRAINHALGHDGGDLVLAEIAARLRAALPHDDLLARIGPDLFGWLTHIEPQAASDLGDFAARSAALRQAIGAPLQQGLGSTLSASLGVALYPEHGVTAEQLLRHSDEALYRAKDRGGSMVEFFEPALQLHADRYLELNKALRLALDADTLQLHYQPLVALDGGALLGVEALLRWRRADGREIPPDQFIPVAETSDLITPLTDWVFRKSCAQMADWRRRGVPVPFVAVNVSAQQFSLPDMVERVTRALADAGLEGDALEIELTESALLENLAATRDILSRLRSRNIGLAVDDFGVGYSSLNYLRSLPVSSIKIDRSFLRGVPDEPEAIPVISAIIALGRDLGLRVVAEGIENQAQRDLLLDKGVAFGQGYLYCHPLPAQELEIWLQARPAELVAA